MPGVINIAGICTFGFFMAAALIMTRVIRFSRNGLIAAIAAYFVGVSFILALIYLYVYVVIGIILGTTIGAFFAMVNGWDTSYVLPISAIMGIIVAVFFAWLKDRK